MFKKIKDFFNSSLGQNLILILVIAFLIFKNEDGESDQDNRETVKLVAFSILTMLSFVASFRFISRLYKSEEKTNATQNKTLLNRNGCILGFISIIVLTIILNLPMITLFAIGVGLLWGALYGIFWLLGKQGMKIWDFLKKHKRKQMFDYFSNRPENVKRNSKNKD